jgi:hypothetical protein
VGIRTHNPWLSSLCPRPMHEAHRGARGMLSLNPRSANCSKRPLSESIPPGSGWDNSPSNNPPVSRRRCSSPLDQGLRTEPDSGPRMRLKPELSERREPRRRSGQGCETDSACKPPFSQFVQSQTRSPRFSAGAALLYCALSIMSSSRSMPMGKPVLRRSGLTMRGATMMPPLRTEPKFVRCP